MKRVPLKRLLACLLFCFVTCQAYAKSERGTPSLEAGFKNPPRSFRPQTWFHTMSGNMTKVGITKDLEAIADIGLRGTLLFSVTQAVPYGNVKFNSDEHMDLIGHMAKESKRLNLDFGIHNCDGWTSTGGPWIKPEQSMKKVVWAEKLVKGGRVDIKMPKGEVLHDYYEDIALLAYPSMSAEMQNHSLKPSISSSDGEAKLSIVNDGSVLEFTRIFASEDKPGWLQFSYDRPFTLRGAEIFLVRDRRAEYSLWASNDGDKFEKVKNLKLHGLGKRKLGMDPVFDAVTAKHFRLMANKSFEIQEVSLKSHATVEDLFSRTSLAKKDFSQLDTISEHPAEFVINSGEVIDLSKNLQPDGSVSAELPPGNWTLMRFGYTTTGATNYPASESGRGLEVDKFSREAFTLHYQEFVERVLNKVNRVAPGVFKYIEIDSYEVGGQNWTQGYADKFKKQFGYELTPYLPLFAGKFVDSSGQSETVLNHIRALNNDLMVENYFKAFTELANADGLQTYIEPYGGPFNELDAGAQADIPMGEFWLKRGLRHIANVASIAHTNNKKIASGEAFTAQYLINWSFHPGMAKIDGDKAFALGLNEFVFHRFAHQANTHVKPGMIMSRWGANFDRTQTWWDTSAKEWVNYITRGQYMLRQGLPASDILMFVGDGHPTVCPDRRGLKPALPNSLNYDCVSPDVLKRRVSVKNGRLVLPEGTSYKMLYLANSNEITLSTLRKIDKLSKAGAIVVGEKPSKLLALTIKEKNSPKAQQAFESLIADIWGREKSYSAVKWLQILRDNKLSPGLRVEGQNGVLYARRKTPNEDIFFVINETGKPQIFETHFDVTGKIPELWDPLTGGYKKLGQFSHEGSTTIAPIRLDTDGAIFVVFREPSEGVKNLPFAQREPSSLEVYLSNNNTLVVEAEENGRFALIKANPEAPSVTVNAATKASTIDGPWKVRFNAAYGFGETLMFDRLIDWKDHGNDEIKHYTGTATYSTTFNVSQERLASDKRVILDLGKVSVSAQVVINGENAGVAWLHPYRLDITDIVKAGENAMTIEVANLWVNRIIGDKRYPDKTGFKQASYLPLPHEKMPEWYVNNEPPPPSKRRTFSTWSFQKADDPLVSSGLLGPVRVISRVRQDLAMP